MIYDNQSWFSIWLKPSSSQCSCRKCGRASLMAFDRHKHATLSNLCKAKTIASLGSWAWDKAGWRSLVDYQSLLRLKASHMLSQQEVPGRIWSRDILHLDAFSHLYKRVCPSIGSSVGQFIHPSNMDYAPKLYSSMNHRSMSGGSHSWSECDDWIGPVRELEKGGTDRRMDRHDL